MFPINDLNFVFCGIATVAATVGYAFTRKQEAGMNLPSPSEDSTQGSAVPMTEKVASQQVSTVQASPSMFTSPTSRRDSLKRKVPHDGFDEPTPDVGYPFNLANIYPHKRCKTPTSEPERVPSVEPQVQPQTETTILPTVQQVAEPSTTPASDGTDEQSSIAADEINTCVLQTPAPEPPRTPSPTPPSNEAVTPEASAVAQEQPNTSAPPTRPATPVAATRPTFGSNTMSASKGFAAFAGSASPFASVAKTGSQSSSFFRSSLWSLEGEILRSQSGPNDTENALAPASGNNEGSEDKEIDDGKEAKHALGAVKISKPKIDFTREENEDVEQELKGVKLFVKRGNKPFSSGMIGHLKLLSEKSTSTERLLFRREPLWQVSMNVKVNSTVRCSYDAEENAVRLVLKEPVISESTSSPKKDGALELVVYALKPGRACPKQDFKEFAESLLKNGQFQKGEHKTSAAPSTSS
ncbi:hypothetical protein EST38_g3496 [Candolleomyces aberdarensis]|uniref:RanBD1 domain-containing protein n=1 Tax=Candolleomyces aberdarensis TaxID=2316362 RepID=A0A4Q2DQE8_9AGAR|nr:hypothetical protein EST38_g3496 [Candolleomyces aberdarensis]